METRQLGKNGPALTFEGFGAWAIGGPLSEEQIPQSEAICRAHF